MEENEITNKEEIDPKDFELFCKGKGKILVKIGERFMLFDADCEFINVI